MKAAVIVFPGSNCDRDVAVALHQATGTWPGMVWHKDSSFEKCDLIVLPGGFSFGDYLRGGAMAARAPVMREVVARAAQGVPILGICNGFQILTEAGLLPGALMRNQELKFVCKMTTLRIENNQSAFTAGYTQGEVVHMPVAHGEGNYRADTATLEELEAHARVVFRYADADGTASETANPNGSCTNIAGIVNDAGNVLGMMPHPERVIGDELGGADGARMFAGLVGALA